MKSTRLASSSSYCLKPSPLIVAGIWLRLSIHSISTFEAIEDPPTGKAGIMALLDLPNEKINHIAEYLLLKELLDLCATCRKIQYAFNIKQLSALAKNPQATYELHYIPLSDVLPLRLSSRSFEDHSPDKLTKHGASLRYILCGNLLEEKFREFGNGPQVQHLLQHGASLHDVPCGINSLLEEKFRLLATICKFNFFSSMAPLSSMSL
ncbi:hypothetical protein VN97_g13088 [Penicillium thymicola]|uniref:F-box domain-containing protein n=1 Tax=Penicillium thymicola TaxID=293382 RepID=A0AAI9T4G0_PENTH|nr:hypothetical protein VN97_g13088 [Penicillium thymicola]